MEYYLTTSRKIPPLKGGGAFFGISGSRRRDDGYLEFPGIGGGRKMGHMGELLDRLLVAAGLLNPWCTTNILRFGCRPLNQEFLMSRIFDLSLKRVCVFFLLATLVTPSRAQNSTDLVQKVEELRALVDRLQARVTELETRLGASPVAEKRALPASGQASTPASPPPAVPEPTSLAGTTINFLIDGYYGYNFNAPIGRANRLRAYDVSSNSFSLNQAGLVLENAPDPDHGKRWGARLDLQWGQATQTLQGNSANELRPEIYRNIFQAYGTFVAPLGHGLRVDFGKWASSIGIEGNYTQDQMNYSRSYWFDYLPFYHMGARASYQLSNQLGINYWLTNGTQQTEAFYGF
jgi:hypothetical protein